MLACDAAVVPVVMGGKGQPLDVGRLTRTIPDGLRRAVAARAAGCEFPGCGRPPSWCEVHHIVGWQEGGPTALHNLAMCVPLASPVAASLGVDRADPGTGCRSSSRPRGSTRSEDPGENPSHTWSPRAEAGSSLITGRTSSGTVRPAVQAARVGAPANPVRTAPGLPRVTPRHPTDGQDDERDDHHRRPHPPRHGELDEGRGGPDDPAGMGAGPRSRRRRRRSGLARPRRRRSAASCSSNTRAGSWGSRCGPVSAGSGPPRCVPCAAPLMPRDGWSCSWRDARAWRAEMADSVGHLRLWGSRLCKAHPGSRRRPRRCGRPRARTSRSDAPACGNVRRSS